MMDTILNETPICFKELEQNIFQFFCYFARETTRRILEHYDNKLMAERDTLVYRNKGLKTTTIKTVYGEVTYERRIYQTKDADGHKCFVYLLDEALHLDKIGLVSVNYAEKVVKELTECSFRKASESVSGTTGQAISHAGAWNIAQAVGRRASLEEDQLVCRMNAGNLLGETVVRVLFEEMDGVWLHMQEGSGHEKAPGYEMKVGTVYEGWDAEDGNRLVGKSVIAGAESSDAFHEKMEALIESKYDLSAVAYRILNGDGGGWIYDPYDPGTVFQLDPFHVKKEMKAKLGAKSEAYRAARKLYEEHKPEELLSYLSAYAGDLGLKAESGSGDGMLETRNKLENVMKLYGYLSNNADGLLPYRLKVKELPEPPEGVVYKGMGVQENQNDTVITRRMKRGRMRWSVSGADNMAKILCANVNGKLTGLVNRYCETLSFDMPMVEDAIVLSAAEANRNPFKRDPYFDAINAHVPLRDAKMTGSLKGMLRSMF